MATMKVELKMNYTTPFPGQEKWAGMTGTIEIPGLSSDPHGYVRVTPDEERPDGFGKRAFLWKASCVDITGRVG